MPRKTAADKEYGCSLEMVKKFLQKSTNDYTKLPENKKRALRARAKSFVLINDELYYTGGRISERKGDKDDSENPENELDHTQVLRKVLFTPEEQEEAIMKAHIAEDGTHLGKNRTGERILSYYWKGMYESMRNLVTSCPGCSARQKSVMNTSVYNLVEQPAPAHTSTATSSSDALASGDSVTGSAVAKPNEDDGSGECEDTADAGDWNDGTFETESAEVVTQSQTAPASVKEEVPDVFFVTAKDICSHFWQKVEIQMFGPFQAGSKQVYVTVALDSYSQFPEATIMEVLSTATLTNFILNLFCRYGMMEKLSLLQNKLTQNKDIFINTQDMQQAGIVPTLLFPHVNPLDERWRHIEQSLGNFVGLYPDFWYYCLETFMFPLRVTLPPEAEYTPYFLVHGREPSLPEKVSNIFTPGSMTSPEIQLTEEQEKQTVAMVISAYGILSDQPSVPSFIPPAEEKKRDEPPSTQKFVVERAKDPELTLGAEKEGEERSSSEQDYDSDNAAFDIADDSDKGEIEQESKDVERNPQQQPPQQRQAVRMSSRQRTLTEKAQKAGLFVNKNYRNVQSQNTQPGSDIKREPGLSEDENDTNVQSHDTQPGSNVQQEDGPSVNKNDRNVQSQITWPGSNVRQEAGLSVDQNYRNVPSLPTQQLFLLRWEPGSNIQQAGGPFLQNPDQNALARGIRSLLFVRNVPGSETPTGGKEKMEADGANEYSRSILPTGSMPPGSIPAGPSLLGLKRTHSDNDDKVAIPRKVKNKTTAEILAEEAISEITTNLHKNSLDAFYFILKQYREQGLYPPGVSDHTKQSIVRLSQLVVLHDGKLYSNAGKSKGRLLIRGEKARLGMLRKAHTRGELHYDRPAVLKHLSEMNVFWHGMSLDLDAFLHGCFECLAHNPQRDKDIVSIPSRSTELSPQERDSADTHLSEDEEEESSYEDLIQFLTTGTFSSVSTPQQQKHIRQRSESFRMIGRSLHYSGDSGDCKTPGSTGQPRQVLLAESSRTSAIKEAHIEDDKHLSLQDTQTKMRRRYFWSGMTFDIHSHAVSCCMKDGHHLTSVCVPHRNPIIQLRVMKFHDYFSNKNIPTLNKSVLRGFENDASVPGSPRKIHTEIVAAIEKIIEEQGKSLSGESSSVSKGRRRKVTKNAHKCPHCGEVIGGMIDFKVHLYKHTGVKPFSCTTCGKTFLSVKGVRTHARKHTGIKPYLCNQCGQKFFYRTSLLKHLEDHKKGELPPFPCDMCSRTFSNKYLLGRHKECKHAADGTINMCDKCGKCFTAARSLKRHEQVHKGIRDYQCQHCHKAFFRKEYLNDHLRTHSENEPERQKRKPRKKSSKNPASPARRAETVSVTTLAGQPIMVVRDGQEIPVQHDSVSVQYEVESLASRARTLTEDELSAIHLLAQDHVTGQK